MPSPFAGVRVSADVASLRRFEASLMPTGAGAETLEANLSLPEAMAWFESVQSGRRFHRRHKKR